MDFFGARCVNCCEGLSHCSSTFELFLSGECRLPCRIALPETRIIGLWCGQLARQSSHWVCASLSEYSLYVDCIFFIEKTGKEHFRRNLNKCLIVAFTGVNSRAGPRHEWSFVRMYSLIPIDIRHILSTHWTISQLLNKPLFLAVRGLPSHHSFCIERQPVRAGQQLLWTEQSGPQNLDSIVWPRAASSAEVFWTGETLPDGFNRIGNLSEALPRLHDLRYRLVQRGVDAIPLQPHWCALRPGVCDVDA